MRLLPFSLCFLSTALAAVRVGEVPPEIRLDRLLPDQPAANATLAALKGKAVVLEFWATWCGSCIAEIPKWNDLVSQFENRPIVFLAITSENPELIGRFLQKDPRKGWIGIAKTTGLMESYGVTGAGHKFLLAPDGRLAADAAGKQLTPAALEDLLANRPVVLPETPRFSSKIRADEPGSAAPVVDAIIRPATSFDHRGGVGRGKDEILFHAATLRGILGSLYSIKQDRIVGDPAEDPTRYDAWIALPGASRGAFQAFARGVACAGLHVSAEKEAREMDVYVLTAPNGEPPGRVKEEFGFVSGMMGTGKGSLRLKGSLGGLCSLLERPLGMPVVDETRVEGIFEIKLTYESGVPDSAIKAVGGLGLKLTKARRPIEFLVVRGAGF